MTAIVPDQLIGLARTHPLPAKLSIGQQLQADVLGSTRHGVSIRVGQEAFLLKTSSRLATAGTLTLQVVQTNAEAIHKVRIVAADERPLPKPINADLAAKPATIASAAPASTVVRQQQIEVTAQPLTRDGQPVGAGQAVRLATHAPVQATADKPILHPNNADRQGPLVQQQQPSKRSSAPVVETRAQMQPGNRPPRDMGGVIGPVRPAPSKISRAEHVKGELPKAAATIVDPKGTIMAKVAARTPAGQIILQTVDQLIRIEQPIDLPVGTDLQMTAMVTPSASLAQPDPGSGIDPTTLLKTLIGLLDDIDRAGRIPEDVDGANRSRLLPTPDRHLAAKLLGLITMRPEQDLANSRLHELEQGTVVRLQKDQIQALTKDLGSAVTEPLADGWKGAALPVGSDPAQAVYLSFREHHWDPEDDSPESDQSSMDAKRAVFDVSFSHLGHCQIDALCQSHRFDLLVRSEHPLTAEDQREITNLFNATCEISGMKGEVGFQEGMFFEPAKRPTATKVVTT